MDGLEVVSMRFSDLDQPSESTPRTLIDPAPPIAEVRDGFECST